MRLLAGVPDSTGALTAVVAANLSNHADSVGVYLGLLPPGGTSNPYGCSPTAVLDLGVFSLLPGEKLTVRIDPEWVCANPAGANGQTWTIKAVADIHADTLHIGANDDFASCDTLVEIFNGACSSNIANDDDSDGNNSKIRSRPIVVDITP